MPLMTLTASTPPALLLVHWYEHWWMIALVVIGVLALLALLLLLRYRALQRRAGELERMVGERTAELEARNRQLEDTIRELHDVNRVKNKFLGIAAHDLKSPLFSIAGFAELLREEAEGETNDLNEARGQFITMLDHIQQSAQRMFGIISGLLQAASEENRIIELRKRRSDLLLVLRPVLNANRLFADEKSIRLTFEDHGVCPVDIDEERMRQVFDNLLSNAIKYSFPDTEVRVTLGCETREDETVARIEILDSGPGLTDRDLRMMFGKFQRLTARPTNGEESSGLGLWIVKTLVELHGGRVWAENDIDGGARFIVELPVLREEAATDDGASPSVSGTSLSTP